MSDDQFKALCNTFGFAPSRALRELIDCVRVQEIEACAKVADDKSVYFQTEAQKAERDDVSGILSTAWHIKVCAAAIRARKENT